MLSYDSYTGKQAVFIKATLQAGSNYSRVYYTVYEGCVFILTFETKSKATLNSLSSELEQIVDECNIATGELVTLAGDMDENVNAFKLDVIEDVKKEVTEE